MNCPFPYCMCKDKELGPAFAQKYPLVTCHVCGKTEHANYFGMIRDRMAVNRLCFNCAYWEETAETDATRALHTVVITPDYVHFVICREDGVPQRDRGFGGSEFKIHFFDDTEVISHNLMCQSTIPAAWRHLFIPNAEIV